MAKTAPAINKIDKIPTTIPAMAPNQKTERKKKRQRRQRKERKKSI